MLDAEVGQEQAGQLLSSASCGPRSLELRPQLAAPKQRLLHAAQIKGSGDSVLAAVSQNASLQAAPSRALEPKVLVPYVQAPGCTPRRIVIERQKRLFQLQDLAQLLLDLGIDSAVPDPPGALPLELFDNTDYECRPIEEWLDMGERTEEETLYLPALFLRPPAEGGKPALWTECHVQDYDEETQRFTVLYKDGMGANAASSAECPRIDLCFRAEDPFIFTRRVVAAYAAREAAEAALRCHLYIECMPTEELPPIEKERVARMVGLALNTDRLKERQMNASSLVSEVNIEYARTMASIIFHHRAAAAAAVAEDWEAGTMGESSDPIFSTFTMLEQPKPKPAPESAVVPIPAHSCLDQKRGFAFHTLLSKREIILCSQKVHTECNKVLGLTLLHTSFTKSYSEEEYKTVQETALASTVTYLKDTWSSALKSAVKASLKEVGKGWFNLQERSSEVYAMSKLKRFLRMVNYIMQVCVHRSGRADARRCGLPPLPTPAPARARPRRRPSPPSPPSLPVPPAHPRPPSRAHAASVRPHPSRRSADSPRRAARRSARRSSSRGRTA